MTSINLANRIHESIAKSYGLASNQIEAPLWNTSQNYIFDTLQAKDWSNRRVNAFWGIWNSFNPMRRNLERIRLCSHNRQRRVALSLKSSEDSLQNKKSHERQKD